MKTLLLSPVQHDVEIICNILPAEELCGGEPLAELTMKLSADSERTNGCINFKEAEKISKWFLDLSKELKGK